VLALTIGILLMSALYVAVEIQLRHAQAGRDIVERSTLVRSLMTRIAADISKSVGVNTPVLQSQGSMSGQAGGAGSSGSSASSGSTNSSSASSSSSSSGSGSTSGATATSGNAAVINLGIQGDSAHLIISGSIVPREFVLGGQMANNNTASLPLSDLRWICYWVLGSGGLARMETSTVTGQDPGSIIPSDSDAAGMVIAPEVQSVTFSYFDGTNWQDSWTGTTPGPDGSTPMGAPVAVAVVIGMAQPGTTDLKSYRRVVAIPTTNQAPATNAAATPASTGSQQ
jgi:hypothetical protein